MNDTEPFKLNVCLTASPATGKAPPVCRMKKALKLLLRAYGIRATWQEPAESGTSGAPNRQEHTGTTQTPSKVIERGKTPANARNSAETGANSTENGSCGGKEADKRGFRVESSKKCIGDFVGAGGNELTRHLQR